VLIHCTIIIIIIIIKRAQFIATKGGAHKNMLQCVYHLRIYIYIYIYIHVHRRESTRSVQSAILPGETFYIIITSSCAGMQRGGVAAEPAGLDDRHSTFNRPRAVLLSRLTEVAKYGGVIIRLTPYIYIHIIIIIIIAHRRLGSPPPHAGP